MTKHLLIAVFLFSGLEVFSQNGKEAANTSVVNNIQRYKLDYEIKNATSIDSTLVLSLDLDQYEHLRTESTDVEIVSVRPAATIILYSVEKTQQNKLKIIQHSQGK